MSETFAFRPGERQTLDEALRRLAPQLARLVVAVDGPAASGKSTTARRVAERLGLPYLDTGAMYRTLTLAALRAGVDLDDGEALAELARRRRIGFGLRTGRATVLLDGDDVAVAIRDPQVTREVSRVSAHAAVRREMVRRQRELGERGGVLDGRDIGTVVFPNADVKVYMVADLRERAARRQAEERARGQTRAVEAIQDELERRDQLDSTRSTSPLVRAADAVLLDTTALSPDEQLDAVLVLAVRCAAAGGEPTGTPPSVRILDDVAAEPADHRSFHSLLYRLVHDGLALWARLAFGVQVHRHPAARTCGSALVACNHVAGLDPVIAGSSLPMEVWYIAKLELFRNPWLERLIRRFNAIPIRRGTADYAALDRAVELLQGGHSVFMFPEGTRQRPGRLGRARWGLGYVAARAGRPIVPVFVRGTRSTRPRGLRREPMQVWVGAPFRVEVASEAPERSVYDAIGALTMRRIAALMLRSAGRNPLPGLELPGEWEDAPAVEVPSGRQPA